MFDWREVVDDLRVGLGILFILAGVALVGFALGTLLGMIFGGR